MMDLCETRIAWPQTSRTGPLREASRCLLPHFYLLKKIFIFWNLLLLLLYEDVWKWALKYS
jgi:hypothetical protein